MCHSNTHTLVMLNWLCHTNQEQNRHQVRKLFQWKCVRIIRSGTKYQYNIFFIPLLVHQSYFFDMCMTCMNNYLYTPLIISLCNFFLISTLLSTPGTILSLIFLARALFSSNSAQSRWRLQIFLL